MHHDQSPEMKACIENCLACYQECISTVMYHCLEAGGEHTEPRHFRLMVACAEICSECADDCERIGEMQSCVDACRRCADSCREMTA